MLFGGKLGLKIVAVATVAAPASSKTELDAMAGLVLHTLGARTRSYPTRDLLGSSTPTTLLKMLLTKHQAKDAESTIPKRKKVPTTIEAGPKSAGQFGINIGIACTGR